MLIIYPAIAMFALTIACIFSMGIARFLAVRRGEVKLSFYRTYTEGSQPNRLHILGRHVQNHFEVPPIFYAGVALVYATQSVSTAALVFAWLFVALRALHSFIHLGSNNVSYRFFAYGTSLLMLTGLWGCLVVSIMGKTA